MWDESDDLKCIFNHLTDETLIIGHFEKCINRATP